MALLGGQPLPLGYGGGPIIPRNPYPPGYYPYDKIFQFRPNFGDIKNESRVARGERKTEFVQLRFAASRARRKIWSVMSGVTRPVNVFCWLG